MANAHTARAIKVVLAIDKFKGSATSAQIAQAAKQAIKEFDDSIEITVVPVADGGDGTVDAIVSLLPEAEIAETAISASVADMPPRTAKYAMTRGGTAVMEVAEGCGLALVPPDKRNVMLASSRGCGQLIADACRRGARHVVLGLGGSATCDCAMGLLDAIGFEFCGDDGKRLVPCGENLIRVRHVRKTPLAARIATEMTFTLLSDVTNPLLGPNGAARVFAPQKGASPSDVERLESGMANFAQFLQKNIATMPGAGAAGGICAGMAAFLNVTVTSGIDEILRLADFGHAAQNASLIITGEGRIDSQTAMGKAPGVILSRGKALGIPVAAICGQCTHEAMRSLGFDSIVQVTPPEMPLSTAMRTDVTLRNVQNAVAAIISQFCRK